VFVTGQASGHGADYGTVAYDASVGTQLWAKLYDGGAASPPTDAGTSIGVSPDGSIVFVSGYSNGLRYDFATLAYDASTGYKLWLSRYNTEPHGDDLAHSLAVSPDRTKVFVTGQTSGTNAGNSYATVAYLAH
jgi:hypothetical protein